ncbi:hypothetical protein HKX48_008100 [Thoreauomyces humboldtii]|nr:hypothetical protein HKX48_008100 [Thoreauomyces humboldtii]
MDKLKFVKTVKFGLDFYTNRSKGAGILAAMLQTCGENETVIAYSVKYENRTKAVMKTCSYYAKVENDKLPELLETDKQLYEILPGDNESRPMKICFDIDLTGSREDDPLQKVKTEIQNLLPGVEMNISGSRKYIDKRKIKFSYHLIAGNYHVNTIEEFVPIKAFCCAEQNKAMGFDPLIYRKNGLLKFVNQSKGDGRVQKILEGSKELVDHTVMQNVSSQSVHLDKVDGLEQYILHNPGNKRKRVSKGDPKLKKLKLIDIGDIPRMNLEPPVGLDIYRANPSQLLSFMPCPKRGDIFQLSNWLNCEVARWCKTVGISFEEFWEWCKQKDYSQTRFERYKAFFERVKEEEFPKSEKFLKECIMAVYNKDILKSAPFRVMDAAVNRHFDHKIDRRWLKGEDILLSKSVKHCVLHVPLGGAKSQSVVEYIVQQIKESPTIRILWLTC